MKVGLLLCFREVFSKEGFYGDLYKNFVRFTPSETIHGVHARPWKNSDLKLINNYNGKKDIFVMDDNDNSFTATLPAATHSHRAVEIVQNHEVFLPGTSETEKLITMNIS